MTVTATNPLIDLHRAAEAELAAWEAIDIVVTYGEPQAEYAVTRKSAGMIDLPQRAVLELTGKDRHAFLNNLLTHQTYDKIAKKGMEPGTGVYAFLLNLRGRIVCDINVLERSDCTWLEMDARYVDGVAKLFDQYLFGEQVKVASRAADLHQLALHGPKAGDLLDQLAEKPLGLTEPLASTTREFFGASVTVWRDDAIGRPGYNLLMPVAAAPVVWTGLLEKFGPLTDHGKRSLRPLGWAMFNTLRIEAGRPIFGIDFEGQPVQTAFPTKANREAGGEAGGGVLPAETGLIDRAVSFTKGCYLGQEIVARMHARQQVARKLVGVRLESDALPFAGETIYDEKQNQIGVVTSSTNSPLLSGHAICLAFVKAAFSAVGSTVFLPAEGAMRKGNVVATPFVEAP